MRTIESCLATREQARWNALCDLSSSHRDRFDEALRTLRRVWLADRYEPSAWSLDLDARLDRGEITLDGAIVMTLRRYGIQGL